MTAKFVSLTYFDTSKKRSARLEINTNHIIQIKEAFLVGKNAELLLVTGTVQLVEQTVDQILRRIQAA